ncbi:MAG: polyphosphate kinase 2 [Hyphomicrobiaceae bacterium]
MSDDAKTPRGSRAKKEAAAAKTKDKTKAKQVEHDKPAREAGAADLDAFDLDDPDLPDAIADNALSAGDYPYEKKLKRKRYEKDLELLQFELVKLQTHVQKHGLRLVIVFEGRDSAGKGGCISRFMMHLNPRHARAVALSKPSDVERGQWYFQRYIPHLPTSGDIVLFDRSWYNRAGVERVMGFCTEEQLADFLRDAPEFENLLVQDGIHLFKFYLTIGRETQLLRFHERRHNPLKQWKLTDIDRASMAKWDAYTEAQHAMFRFTNTATAPWTVVRANDQRRARLESIRFVLAHFDYEAKDISVAHAPDAKIVGNDKAFLYGT